MWSLPESKTLKKVKVISKKGSWHGKVQSQSSKVTHYDLKSLKSLILDKLLREMKK